MANSNVWEEVVECNGDDGKPTVWAKKLDEDRFVYVEKDPDGINITVSTWNTDSFHKLNSRPYRTVSGAKRFADRYIEDYLEDNTKENLKKSLKI